MRGPEVLSTAGMGEQVERSSSPVSPSAGVPPGIPERLQTFARSLSEFGEISNPEQFARELRTLSPPLQRALISLLQDVRVFSGEVDELTRRIENFESGLNSSEGISLDQASLKLSDRTLALPIPLERVVVILKISEFERQRRTNERSVEEQLDAYRHAGEDGASKYQAHLRQKEVIDSWRALIPEEQIFEWDRIDWRAHQNAAAVVCIGGDNSMQLATHDAPENVLFVGVNSDPTTSAGATLLGAEYTHEQTLKNLLDGEYKVELWNKLEVSVSKGGELLNRISGPLHALSEVFIGEEGRRHTSKHALTLPGGGTEKQTGSGLIIATGVGTLDGAWADSATKMRRDIADSIKPGPEDSEALYILTEPQNGRLSGHAAHRGSLRAGESLVIESKNKRDGKLYLDSLDGIPFPAGAKAEIRISEKPVRVMRFLEHATEDFCS